MSERAVHLCAAQRRCPVGSADHLSELRHDSSLDCLSCIPVRCAALRRLIHARHAVGVQGSCNTQLAMAALTVAALPPGAVSQLLQHCAAGRQRRSAPPALRGPAWDSRSGTAVRPGRRRLARPAGTAQPATCGVGQPAAPALRPAVLTARPAGPGRALRLRWSDSETARPRLPVARAQWSESRAQWSESRPGVAPAAPRAAGHASSSAAGPVNTPGQPESRGPRPVAAQAAGGGSGGQSALRLQPRRGGRPGHPFRVGLGFLGRLAGTCRP